MQDEIVPERGERQARRYTSEPDRLAGVEVLPEYEFILEAVQAGCPAIFVTGKAGTGKSTLIHWLQPDRFLRRGGADRGGRRVRARRHHPRVLRLAAGVAWSS